MRPQLSVNINKVALLRNSRGQDRPNLLWVIDLLVKAGARGITVHPRSDQRHVHFEDVPVVAEYLREQHPGVEFNVECENSPFLLDLVCSVRPEQCTLVPVTEGEVTSDHGWDLEKHGQEVAAAVSQLSDQRIRTSLFMDCEPENMSLAAKVGAHRVELYTGPYAWAWGTACQEIERKRLYQTGAAALAVGLVLNAGHDLDRFNLLGLRDLKGLAEVSIGHAHICRALEVGLHQSTRELLSALGYE